MRSISNAFFWKVEVVQTDRWKYGPLELVFVDERFRRGCRTKRQVELSVAIHDWNRSSSAGFVRPGDTIEILKREISGFTGSAANPNIVFVPRHPMTGVTSLHVMLASLLPDTILRDAGISRKPALLHLSLVGNYDLSATYPSTVEALFSKFLWTKLAPAARLKESFFSKASTIRLLAGDISFWMQRLYRIALDRSEWFDEVDNSRECPTKDLLELETSLRNGVDSCLRDTVMVRRPLYGGDIWDINDAVERDDIIAAAINGDGVMDSLDPVLEILHGHRTHEDFSDRYSWVKEDFERSFYSKRSKLKVDLVETVDDVPVWASNEHEGYDRVLFRDLLAFLNIRERRLVVALRMGKTVTEIATEEGLSGHAAVSRRVKQLKKKLEALLAAA